MARHHLAQLNVGRLLAPIDSPQIRGFVDGLEPINALADSAQGFVWRLQTEDGDATAVRISDDELLIVNLSVWDSIDALKAFAYRSDHRHYLARRAEWFEHSGEPYLVLWWVPAGHIPSVGEAADRLQQLRGHGPSAEAFTFDEVYLR
jgi:hypothetical protein